MSIFLSISKSVLSVTLLFDFIADPFLPGPDHNECYGGYAMWVEVEGPAPLGYTALFQAKNSYNDL